MSTPKDVERRERKIDAALKETFPASDSPTFVGGVSTERGKGIVKDERGQQQPADRTVRPATGSTSGLGAFRSCAGFRTPAWDAIHALRRPASEKRQGRKSREVGTGGAADAMGI